MPPPKALYVALEPPSDPAAFLEAVPELSLARGLEGSPYHHLDTLEHVLEVVRRVEEELEVPRLGARVPAGRVEGLRLAALLHDVAKPVTRGELEGRVLFVAHDSLGAALVRRICRRPGGAAAPPAPPPPPPPPPGRSPPPPTPRWAPPSCDGSAAASASRPPTPTSPRP